MEQLKRFSSVILAVLLLGAIWFGFRLVQPLTSPAEPVEAGSRINLPIVAVRDSPAEATSTPTHTPLTPTATHTATVTATRTPRNTFTPRPSPTETVPALPPSAEVKGMYGYGQLLPLSCESRSAADWARHFGFDIRELEFFNRLPVSEDPDEGFVGSVYGGWGQIPPNPYGVHAAPVAKLLREYGVKAQAVKNLTLEEAFEEIASGNPVMVWVVGHVEPGQGTEIEVNGVTRVVARYEHTVILIGYDEHTVTILDGKKIYQRPIERFIASWGALENMAILWDDSLPTLPSVTPTLPPDSSSPTPEEPTEKPTQTPQISDPYILTPSATITPTQP